MTSTVLKDVRPNKKYSCFRKCEWREKCLSGRPQNFFFYWFSIEILFSSLVSFAFFYSCFLLFVVVCYIFWYTFDYAGGWVIKKNLPSRFPVIRLLFLTLVYNNLANPGLLQRNPSSKLFWLTNSWVDKMQLPAHHKKAVKTNKNQSTIIKKFKLIFPGKSYFG